jgi:O-antigen/teichoic acid export membrane protein
VSQDGEPRPAVDVLDTAAAGPAAARGGAMRAGGYAVSTLLAVVSVPLMIRHLGVERFGQYVTVLSLVTIIGGLTEAGINTIALREYASRTGADRTLVLRDLLGMRIVLTLAGIALGVGFALAADYPSVLVLGTIAVGIGLLLQSMQTLLAIALHGELRFGWITVTEVLRQLLFVVFVVGLVLADAQLGTFFVAQIPAFAITLVITGLLVRRIMPLWPAIRPGRWMPILRDTIAYAAAVALNAAYFRIAVIALSLLATESETGYFATAFRVIEVLLGIPVLIIGAAFPILARAARDDRERLDNAAVRLLELGLILGVWVALGLALAAEPIITLVAGAASDPSVELLRLQGFALIATFVAVAAGYTLISLRRNMAVLAANAAAFATALVLSVVLISRYGATGAAVAVLVAELVLAAASLAALSRARPAVLGALRRAPLILSAGGLAALVVLVPGVPALADTLLAVAAYPVLLAVFGCFPPEIGHALRAGRARPGSLA